MITALLIIAATVALDRLTKYFAIQWLMPLYSVPLIGDVLHLTYVENTGAAFGILRDKRWVFLVISTVAIVGILVFLIVYGRKNRLLTVSLAMIAGGGIGNMIDRIAYGYVVDFIDFTLIDFPVFNGADSFVTIGAVLLVIYFFRYEMKSEKGTVGE